VPRVVSGAKETKLDGSNSRLLMDDMLTLYPQLWNAIACQVPLLGMKRHTRLAAAALWIAGCDDSDQPGEWTFIKTFSPCQNVEKKGKSILPCCSPPRRATTVSFYENIGGDHDAAAGNEQAAFMSRWGTNTSGRT